MPAKRARKGGPAAKRARKALLLCDTAWGTYADDVALAVDWAALTGALDGLMAPSLWASGLTYDAVATALPLRPTGGTKVSLLGAARGERAGGLPEHPAAEPLFVVSSSVALEVIANKGRGWVAKQRLPAGTVVLVERPLVAILDAEWGDKAWASCGSADTAALGIRLAGRYAASAGQVLSMLHPPEGCVPDIPNEEEDSEDEENAEALREAVDTAWMMAEGLSVAEALRLQAVVRLNSLGFYTNSEQLCHHGNFTALTGSGVFSLASGFNHSCEPSVARFSIGDVTVFVTNGEVQAGEELCISYIETELLCAPTSLRCQSLNRDFTCTCPRCSASPSAGEVREGPRRYVRVDARVQAELSLLPPSDRIAAVEAALRGEEGEGQEEGEEEGNEAPALVLGKDAQELRVVQALAQMQLGSHAEALALWRRLGGFTCQHCPPFDEAVAVYAAQAALCALMCEPDAAAQYVAIAVAAHRIVSGSSLFRWRYKREVDEAMVSAEAKEEFWKLVDATACIAKDLPEVVAMWKFEAGEIPAACEQA